MHHTKKVNGPECAVKWLVIKQQFHCLLGLGLDEYSMSATSILKTRSFIKKLSTEKMKELADKALDCETEAEVQALVKEYTK